MIPGSVPYLRLIYGYPQPRFFPWTRWDSIKHQAFDFLYLVRLRDRLRCPKCLAVGTYKPHGGWCDKIYDSWTNYRGLAIAFAHGARYATERRWVCKYCGYTHDENGEHWGAPNNKTKVWGERCADSVPTPQEAVRQLCGSTWPWRG